METQEENFLARESTENPLTNLIYLRESPKAPSLKSKGKIHLRARAMEHQEINCKVAIKEKRNLAE